MSKYAIIGATSGWGSGRLAHYTARRGPNPLESQHRLLGSQNGVYDCLKLRESDPCTSKLGLFARSRMAQQEGLLAGYATISLQLARRASGISWFGLCIAISGLLIVSFWKWSTQTAGDLGVALRWLLDDPRPCISADAIDAFATTNNNAAEHGTETQPHRRGTTPCCHSVHKFWKPWPNTIR
jgi:hypothetical protein